MTKMTEAEKIERRARHEALKKLKQELVPLNAGNIKHMSERASNYLIRTESDCLLRWHEESGQYYEVLYMTAPRKIDDIEEYVKDLAKTWGGKY